jgi:hypothetical protein
MTRSIAAPLVALAALWALAIPVQAGSLSGTFDGVTTLTPTGTPGIFIQNFTGDGTDDTYGAFTPTGMSTVDVSHPPNIKISGGMLSEVFLEGTLFGTTSGTGSGNGMGSAMFTIDFVITGGTGIFTDAKGEATLTGTITQTGPTTGAISNGSYVGSFTIPEPSSLTLLAPAAALGAIVLVRQRRRQVVS